MVIALVPTTMIRVAVVVGLVVASNGLSIRGVSEPPPTEEIEVTPEQIESKWANMDEFLGIMFNMACKWSKSKDIVGEAAELLHNGDLTKDNYDQWVANKQAVGLQKMDKACGMIVANGKKTCRSACIDRWGSNMQERDHCDDLCVAVYDRFEKECTKKVDLVEQVYENQQKGMQMKKQCYTGWCKDLPNVWMKPDTASMRAEVTTSCTRRCTPSILTNACQKEYAAEIDFLKASIERKCHANHTVMECYNASQATAKSEVETCALNVEAECQTEFEDCKTKAQTDNSPQEALSFCENRKKTCGIKRSGKCQADYNAELATIKAKCEKEEEDRAQTCADDAMVAKEESFMTECKDSKSKTCEKDCANNCKVDEMQQCLAETQSKDGIEETCSDFWNLLTQSSEVDPATGNPIVMLSSHSSLLKH